MSAFVFSQDRVPALDLSDLQRLAEQVGRFAEVGNLEGIRAELAAAELGDTFKLDTYLHPSLPRPVVKGKGFGGYYRFTLDLSPWRSRLGDGSPWAELERLVESFWPVDYVADGVEIDATADGDVIINVEIVDPIRDQVRALEVFRDLQRTLDVIFPRTKPGRPRDRFTSLSIFSAHEGGIGESGPLL